MALRPDLSCLSGLSETLIELGGDGDLIKAAKDANGINLELMKSVIDNINGKMPLKCYNYEINTIEDSVKRIIDFINLKVDYFPDTHNVYEWELYRDCPELYADRMKDLQYRWRWALPGQVTDPFANCGEGLEFNVPKDNIMGKYKSIEYDLDKKVLINSNEYNTLPWYTKDSGNGIILAGGAITSTILSSNDFSDYDLFVIAKNEDEALDIIKKTIDIISNNNDKYIHITIKENVIHILHDYDKPIQIITRLYESPAQVINGFDVDACCIGYYPEKGIFMATRASRCFKNGWMLLDPMCQSPSYEYRLTKYANRYNLGIYVPLFKNINYDREIILYKKDETTYLYFRPTKLMMIRGLTRLNAFMNNNKYLCNKLIQRTYYGQTDYNKSKIITILYDELKLSDIKFIKINPQSQGKFLSGSFQPTYNYDFYKYYDKLVDQIEYEKKNIYSIKEDIERYNINDIIFKFYFYYKYNGYIKMAKIKNIDDNITKHIINDNIKRRIRNSSSDDSDE